MKSYDDLLEQIDRLTAALQDLAVSAWLETIPLADSRRFRPALERAWEEIDQDGALRDWELLYRTTPDLGAARPRLVPAPREVEA